MWDMYKMPVLSELLGWWVIEISLQKHTHQSPCGNNLNNIYVYK